MIVKEKTLNSFNEYPAEAIATPSEMKTHRTVSSIWPLFAILRLLKFFLIQAVSKKEDVQEKQKEDVQEKQAEFSDLPNEIQEIIFCQVPIGHFDKLNKDSNDHVYRQKVLKACMYGYVGNDAEEAKKYMIELYDEISILANEHLIPLEYIVYKPGFFIVLDPLAILKKLSALTTEEIFNIFNVDNIKSSFKNKRKKTKTHSFQKLAKFLILNNKLEPHALKDKGKNALIEAAKRHYYPIVELLIKLGTDHNIDYDGKCLLNHFISDENLELTAFLIEKGADVNSIDSKGNTPLMFVRTSCALARLLMENGAKAMINHRNNTGETALHTAAIQGDLKTIQFLLEQGADIDICDNRGRTPLFSAIWKERAGVVKFLVDHGANVNFVTRRHNSMLIRATEAPKILKILLESNKSTDINYNGPIGSALYFAACEGEVTSIKLLLKHGADINILSNGDENTPLHGAVKNKKYPAAKLLVEKGAEINTLNAKGNTALHLAAITEDQEMVQLLLMFGADPTLLNNAGDTPIELAKKPATKACFTKVSNDRNN